MAQLFKANKVASYHDNVTNTLFRIFAIKMLVAFAKVFAINFAKTLTML